MVSRLWAVVYVVVVVMVMVVDSVVADLPHKVVGAETVHMNAERRKARLMARLQEVRPDHAAAAVTTFGNTRYFHCVCGVTAATCTRVAGH